MDPYPTDEKTKRPRTAMEKVKAIILDNLLIILMILAIIIGVALGLGLRETPGWEYWQKRKLHYLRFPGDLLLNMLKMLILPLIISSLISSLAALDTRASGRMGLRAVVYYLTTTLAAVILGIILVLSIQPGSRGAGKEEIDRSGKAKQTEPLDALFDLIRNCFPDNLVAACFQKQETQVGTFNVTVAAANVTNITTTMAPDLTNDTSKDGSFSVPFPKVTTADGMNILGLVVFSIFFGIIIGKMGEQGKPLLDFFEALHQATMKLVMLVIWYSPLGIIFLVATKIVEMKDPATVFAQLGYYTATVLAGLAVHGFIVLPLIYLIAARRNPYIFMYRMSKALLTAWGTASSSATLPITMECLEYRNGVDPRVTKFVAPIGATINMDGTALYEAVASIFIAQVNNYDLDVGHVITISLTATAAAIGAAGVPQAGLVTMAIVLTAVGLPVDDVTLILAIDWFLDRFRTAINVLGDSYGAGIVGQLSKVDLANMDRLDQEQIISEQEANGIVLNSKTLDGDVKLNGVDNAVFTDSDTKM